MNKANIKNSKKWLSGIQLLLCLILTVPAGIMVSCSDDDEAVKTALSAPNVSVNGKTVSSISFSWQAIDGATQYAYEAKDGNECIVAGGTTSASSVKVTGLKPQTSYTFNFWAYAALDDSHTTSAVTSLTTTTNAVQQLSAPTSVSYTQTTAGIELTWQAVDNASYYLIRYELNDSIRQDSTETATYTLSALPVGKHKVWLRAMSSDENYSNSEDVETEVVKKKDELWRKDANYFCEALGSNFSCQIVAYKDGTYAIDGLFNSSDILEFMIDESSVVDDIPEIVLTNYYQATPPYYYFRAGDYTLCIYYQHGSGYSGWEGDTDEPGIWFYVYLYRGSDYLGAGYDYITW